MTKKLIYNPENPKGILVDFTDAELSQKVIDDEKTVIRKTEFNAKRYHISCIIRKRTQYCICKFGIWSRSVYLYFNRRQMISFIIL